MTRSMGGILDTPGRRGNSSYAAYHDGTLVLPFAPNVRPDPLLEVVHTSFRNRVLGPDFVCVGAKSAFHRGTYRMNLYDNLGSDTATEGLTRDLRLFVDEYRDTPPNFVSFVAAFAGPAVPHEAAFEALLWRQLQKLHDVDSLHHGWDPTVSADPYDPGFSFSYAGQAFFVVGLHPVSSRWARRFAWPTLVFNRHDQFMRLRRDGRFGPMQRAIRSRERALQGDSNPMLQEFGTRSEARQYSGRAVDEAWKCPFRPRTGDAGMSASPEDVVE